MVALPTPARLATPSTVSAEKPTSASSSSVASRIAWWASSLRGRPALPALSACVATAFLFDSGPLGESPRALPGRRITILYVSFLIYRRTGGRDGGEAGEVGSRGRPGRRGLRARRDLGCDRRARPRPALRDPREGAEA